MNEIDSEGERRKHQHQAQNERPRLLLYHSPKACQERGQFQSVKGCPENRFLVGNHPKAVKGVDAEKKRGSG